MAVLLGFHIQTIQWNVSNPHVSTDVADYTGEAAINWPPSQWPVTRTPISTLLTHWPVEAQGRSLSGFHAIRYSDDYYHRIHITPTQVDLGNVVSTQSFPVYVWNAHLVSKTLTAVTGAGEGIEIGHPSPLPITFTPLLELLWQISVTPQGPATIDDWLDWVFADADAPMVHITGNRIVPWAFLHNWREPLVERLSWLTDVLTSPSGAEQRRALRIAPRRTFKGQFIVHADERAFFDLIQFGWGLRQWALPMWADVQWLTADVPAGALRIDCETAGRDFDAGSLVILLGDDPQQAEAAQVAAVDATGIDLVREVQQHWPAHITRIYPARTARMTAPAQITRRTDNLASAEARFEVTEPCEWPAALPTVEMYRGLPVFTLAPNEVNDLTLTHERLSEMLDNKVGTPRVTDTAGIGFQLQQHVWMLAGRAEHSAWRGLVYALRGRQGVVWVPTFADDLRIFGQASGVNFPVRAVGYARYGNNVPGRRDIRIELADGSVLHRRITSAAQTGVGVETLVLDAALPASLSDAQVRRISFMSLCRLGSDDVEIEHKTDADGVAEAVATWRGVRDELEEMEVVP